MYSLEELNAIRLGLNSLTIPSATAKAMAALQVKVEKQIAKEEKKKEVELVKKLEQDA
jgi:hypothetical protein|tara:strand:- start:1630 stop:1803 length:174 start_codon:yes stop_codon:yes gene_type:complete